MPIDLENELDTLVDAASLTAVLAQLSAPRSSVLDYEGLQCARPHAPSCNQVVRAWGNILQGGLH
jgi:hypothetical protein